MPAVSSAQDMPSISEGDGDADLELSVDASRMASVSGLLPPSFPGAAASSCLVLAFPHIRMFAHIEREDRRGKKGGEGE